MSGGRALIMEDHCVLCGRCLAVCPQEAKTLSSELPQVKAMIQRGEQVVAQLAPSYVGLLDFREIGQVRSALRKLGFADVFETAEGAAAVTAEYLQLIEEGRMDNIITTCCPVINDMIEMYFPSLVPFLAPVVSPMIASGRMIKQALGSDTRVVFIGPCIAKRKEARDPRHADAVDAVISFEELSGWLKEKEIRIDACENDPFPFDPAVNRLYPVTGGVLASVRAGLPAESARQQYRQFAVHGLSSCNELCRDMVAGSVHRCVIEMNSCENGCIKGPAVTKKGVYPYKIKLDMEEAIQPVSAARDIVRRRTEGVDLKKRFEDRSIEEPFPSEDEIREILAKTGKHCAEDELNCGACGKADDVRMVQSLMSGDRSVRRIVSGGTSASIVSRILNRPMQVSMDYDSSGLPPEGHIDGIDLVTEGVLTLARVIQILKEYAEPDHVDRSFFKKLDEPNPAAKIARMIIEDCTQVRLIVGTAVNAAYQNPDLPLELGLRMNLTKQLTEAIAAVGKQVEQETY